MIIKVGKHEVELYDSVQNMGIIRLQKFNKYQMLAIEIGNSFQDYDKRTAKVYEFIKNDLKNEALQELNNRRQTVFNAYNEYTPTGRALAIIVKRIDNTEYTDYSASTLDEILQYLENIGFTYEMALEHIKSVKKKSKQN